MRYVVKEADIRKDREILLRLLIENREKKYPYQKRYDWLYYDNPYGEAIAWIICNDKTNLPVGFTAVYPRKMLVQNKEIVAWNCGDFSIDKKYRTLGIALKLRKEAKYHVDSGEIPFLYAHPNNQMVHIHLKARHKQIALMKRYAFLIDLSKVLNKNIIEKSAARILNPLLKEVLKFRFKNIGEYQIQDKTALEFNDQHREVCHVVHRDFPVMGLRDKEYLTWKFANHPILSYQLFNYYKQNQLRGYIIFFLKDDMANLMEVIACKPFGKEMLATFINYLVDIHQSVRTISTIQQEYNPMVTSLLEIGFKYRPDATSSAIAYSANEEIKELIHDGEKWFMNVGDRDA